MHPLFVTLLLVGRFASPSGIFVAMPSNDAQLTSPFTLTASAGTCNSQPTASTGYSVDYGVTTFEPASFNAMVIAGTGNHILHVKCWGTSGAAGDTDINITIVPPSAGPPASIRTASSIQDLPGWTWNHDPGTPGAATGTSTLVNSPSLSGSARQYSFSFTNYGGEIFYNPFGADTNATHFIYDTELWLTNPAGIANIEMDMNQVLANGNTVIYGVQCDGYSGMWDYTINSGTPAISVDTWVHSNAACPEPKTWAPNTWHHIQIAYSRDNVGNVTYQSVVLDGVESDFVGATGNSAFTLGWASTLLTNFQIDGLGPGGSVTAYLDNLSVYRW